MASGYGSESAAGVVVLGMAGVAVRSSSWCWRGGAEGRVPDVRVGDDGEKRAEEGSRTVVRSSSVVAAAFIATTLSHPPSA